MSEINDVIDLLKYFLFLFIFLFNRDSRPNIRIAAVEILLKYTAQPENIKTVKDTNICEQLIRLIGDQLVLLFNLLEYCKISIINTY